MRLVPLVFATLLLAPSASAQDSAAEEDVRVNQLIIYGEDECPPSTDEEIIVCARMPEDERFRIPQGLRSDPNDPAGQSWTNRAIELSYVGRTGAGSCSTVGPGGFTGCQAGLLRQARAERRAENAVNWHRLIEEAREARLGQIDAEAEAIEAERNPEP